MLDPSQVGGAIAGAMRRFGFPAEALAEYQQQQLQALVRHAAEHSAFYRKRYASIDLNHIRLEALPIVDKAVVMENFNDVVTDPRLKFEEVKRFCTSELDPDRPWHLDAFAAMLTSGTSGDKGFFVMDGAALADAIAMGVRQSTRPGKPTEEKAKQPEHRFAAVMLIEPFDAAGVLVRMIPEHLGPKKLVDNRQDLADVVAQLNDFQPTLISSFPYTLRLLAGEAGAGRLKIGPRRITSSGDVLTPSDRAAVEGAFDVKIFDYYCCTEATYLAWECEAHSGLHLNADFNIVESVDSDNQPVPEGCLGDKILITNLTNRVMPLIRYELTDQVEIVSAGERCPCGCTLPRIRTVAGRTEQIIELPGAGGGTVPLIPEQIDDFVGRLPTNYQVIQEGPAKLTVNYIVLSEADAEGLSHEIPESLTSCFERYGVASTVDVDLRRVEALEPVRPGSTKICHYWNRCR